ncbi:MAG: hypothetical protein ACRDH2_08990 [Anaerolineales bacterium]
MDWQSVLDDRFWLTLLAVVGIGLTIAVLLLGWVFWRVRRIQLPPGADLLTALRATPLSVVLLLDALDFSLDFLSAPIAWIILGRLGLAPLRGVTMFESLIPGTQFLPTMTTAWILARVFRPEQLPYRRIK